MPPIVTTTAADVPPVVPDGVGVGVGAAVGLELLSLHAAAATVTTTRVNSRTMDLAFMRDLLPAPEQQRLCPERVGLPPVAT
jgi:hypothetical protein